MNTENLKLTDDSISKIAQLLQVAILTGTDIVDNLRMMTFVVNDDGALAPDPEFVERLDQNIQTMVNEAMDAAAAAKTENS